MPTKRAIGVYRVSERGGRDEILSPDIQVNGMHAVCKRERMRLVATLDEVDVSGKLPLEKRRGMWPAVQAIEAGRADVILVHQFDRLVRNLTVQREIVDRVERAGGTVLAGDFGEVSHKTAIKRLTSNLMGAIHEYYAEVIGEKAGAAQAEAIRRGVYLATDRELPRGYKRNAKRQLTPESKRARRTVTEAFAMRARGETVAAVRIYLRGRGWAISHASVDRMLANRAYLGESRFGELVNREAHEPMVDPDVFDAVQAMRVPAGRRAKTDHLLARLSILRCGSCGGRMSAEAGHGRRHDTYRCGRKPGDCPRPMFIAAAIVEQVAKQEAQRIAADATGRASATAEYEEACQRRDEAKRVLDNAVEAFTGLEDMASAKEKLAGLRAKYEHHRDLVDNLAPIGATKTVSLANWDDLTLAERRIGIRATIARINVHVGRGAERVVVQPLRK